MLLGFAEESLCSVFRQRRCALVYELLHGGDLYRRRDSSPGFDVQLSRSPASQIQTKSRRGGVLRTFGWISIPGPGEKSQITCRLQASKAYLWHERLRTATEASAFSTSPFQNLFELSMLWPGFGFKVCRGLAHLHKHRPKIFHRMLGVFWGLFIEALYHVLWQVTSRARTYSSAATARRKSQISATCHDDFGCIGMMH